MWPTPLGRGDKQGMVFGWPFALHRASNFVLVCPKQGLNLF